MIYLASDHRGMLRKEEIKKLLDELKLEHYDCGNMMFDPNDDEVDFVNKACQRMEADQADSKGILFCGSGVMVDIAANRYPQVRACLAFSKKQVEMGRHDDDCNALCIAADFFNLQDTTTFVKAFLKTEFSGDERFVRRINKLKNGN